jgi:hypothetical protein
MNRSLPYLDHGIIMHHALNSPSADLTLTGIVALAKALHISQRSSSARSSIPGAVVSVFVAGNSTLHAQHLTQLNVRVKLIPETFYTLASLNAGLHSDITNSWSTLH